MSKKILIKADLIGDKPKEPEKKDPCQEACEKACKDKCKKACKDKCEMPCNELCCKKKYEMPCNEACCKKKCDMACNEACCKKGTSSCYWYRCTLSCYSSPCGLPSCHYYSSGCGVPKPLLGHGHNKRRSPGVSGECGIQ